MKNIEEIIQEISLLENLKIDLRIIKKFPQSGGKSEIVLKDIRRSTERLIKLLNIDVKIETPQKGDICAFWDDEIGFAKIGIFVRMHGQYWDEDGCFWENCKVIQKGEGNV